MRFSVRVLLLLGGILVGSLGAVYVANEYIFSKNTAPAAADDDPEDVTLTDTMFEDLFSRNKVINETGTMDKSESPFWWISSGGYVSLRAGTANTIQGELAEGAEWQVRFAENNPDSTDGGFHPQNIFRMVTRSRWLDYRQQCHFRINKLNLSDSEARNQSNGVFLFNRYQDQNNLYYTGLRVDGRAVIKKKYRDVYYTMAEAIVVEGEYDRTTQPNLLPVDSWVGIASEIETRADGTVEIRFYVDLNNSGDWQLAATAIDDGVSYGGPAIRNAGHAGIRTDFMDATFQYYRLLADGVED